MRNRGTDIEIEARLEEIRQLSGRGISYSRIVGYLRDKFGISISTAKKNIRKARENQLNGLVDTSEVLNRLDYQYLKANERENGELATKIALEKFRIQNITGGKMNNAPPQAVSVSPDLARALQRLADRKASPGSTD